MVLFPHAEPRRSRAANTRATFFGCLLAILFGWSAASAADVQGTIDFDVQGLPAGTILESVDLAWLAASAASFAANNSCSACLRSLISLAEACI